MQKQEIHILIVDDDVTLSKALSLALSKAGYKVSTAQKPDEALSLIKLQPIHLALVDCMLPKMNGRDLAKKIKAEADSDIIIVLMSGIYKDKAFIREAQQATGAVQFLTKPFDLEYLLKEVETAVKDLVDAPLAKLQQFMAKADVSPKDRVRAVDEAEMVHGFDLPWIYSLLMHPSVTGHLNIITADGEVCGVAFADGQIVQVFQNDAKSYFGVLLVEYGYVSQAELDMALSKSTKGKKLGQVLIEENLLSPHAIDIVMADQQGLRLSRTIADTSVKVNFIETDDMKINVITDRAAFCELLNDWLISKLTLDWLKSYYTPWMRHSLLKGGDWSATHRALSLPVVLRVPDFLPTLLQSDCLESALHKMGDNEEHFFRALHALVINRVLQFGAQVSKTDYDAARARLTKLNERLEAQNHFERLGVSQKAKDSEIRRAYHELAKVLHPDKLGLDAPGDVRDLAKKTFEKISVAHSVLSDKVKKDHYVMELERGRADAILEAEQLGEQARNLLSKGEIRNAREMLERAVLLAPPTSEIRLLLMWAKLKSAGAERDSRLLSAIKDELAQIPPEDRHHATFYLVRGLHLKAIGDLMSARRNFEQVVSLQPDSIDARRELNLIQTKTAPKPVNILSGDLKDVVGLLFKKKK